MNSLPPEVDIMQDGVIDTSDVRLLLSHWRQRGQIPPTTLIDDCEDGDRFSQLGRGSYWMTLDDSPSNPVPQATMDVNTNISWPRDDEPMWQRPSGSLPISTPVEGGSKPHHPKCRGDEGAHCGSAGMSISN